MYRDIYISDISVLGAEMIAGDVWLLIRDMIKIHKNMVKSAFGYYFVQYMKSKFTLHKCMHNCIVSI